MLIGQLGITPPTVVAVSVDGGTNSPGDISDNGADGEDGPRIQVAGSIAPGARIALYFAPNTNQGFQDAISARSTTPPLRPSAISISWGAPSPLGTRPRSRASITASKRRRHGRLRRLRRLGLERWRLRRREPCRFFPHPVLTCWPVAYDDVSDGVRSTEMHRRKRPAAGGGATGGCFQLFPCPPMAVQYVPSSGNGGGRGVPDVAGDAAPETGYQILVDGQSAVVGGTSAVAPLWDCRAVNQQTGRSVGFLNPSLYSGGESNFYDVTSGSNGSYNAATGSIRALVLVCPTVKQCPRWLQVTKLTSNPLVWSCRTQCHNLPRPSRWRRCRFARGATPAVAPLGLGRASGIRSRSAPLLAVRQEYSAPLAGWFITRPAVPNIPVAPPAKRSAAVRMPLARPIPSGATAGVAPRAKRHRRHLLGLGKLWHWVRHDHSKDQSKAASSTD